MPGAGRWCNTMSQEAAGITANLTAQIPPKGVRIQMFENTVLAAFNSKNSGWPASPLDSLTRRLVCREGKWLVYIHCPNSAPRPPYTTTELDREFPDSHPLVHTLNKPSAYVGWGLWKKQGNWDKWFKIPTLTLLRVGYTNQETNITIQQERHTDSLSP